MKNITYLDVFDRAKRVHGSATAVVTEGGNRYTYREFDDRSTRLSNALEARVGSDPVAVLTGNSPVALEAMIAGHKRGTPTVQLPFREEVATLGEMIETAGADALLFDDEHAEIATRLLQEGSISVGIHAGETRIETGQVTSYERVVADASATLPSDLPAEGPAGIFFTSGTTARPKAVAFDSHQLWLGASQGVMEQGIEPTDVAIVPTPWYHMVTTDAWLYPHWAVGATTVLHDGFDPETVLELVETHDATGILAVPTQLVQLVETQTAHGYDLSSLRYLRTGGAVLSENLVERTAEHLTSNIYNIYGLTEAGPNLTFARPGDQLERPGTVGTESFAWELRIVRAVPERSTPDPRATVDPGEVGEVIARGPALPDGYIHNPAAEKRTFFGEWLRTGDIARVDEDGFLFIVDRVDNMFTSGGENIYPGEIERTLESHDGVSEAVVVGTDDDTWGNTITAVVVGDATDETLDRYCLEDQSLADYKRPREYVFRSEPLPKTATGTVDREQVRDDHF